MSESHAPAPYRVLARKYRPATFAELIGQAAMVRTLTNAISSGRLAHAFILTGVRGVGKTTTARIIARALNCIGPDGKGGPTAEPCGRCEHCIAITEDRHVDVLEMDAASRTGVDDIRELIEGVKYRPISAREKVYIIDEVHMLSRQAFNALLKTLEEPPEHVKFVFATTEIRKIPVTVVSRCQRFDLRRVDAETLAGHLAAIAEKEDAKVRPDAMALIARAADGSVRDGLSLLDQAIADFSAHDGAGEITAEQGRDMLGLADRTQLFDLFDAVMKGEIKSALELLAEMYKAGADPVVVLQDLLELTHWLTRVKVVPEAARALDVPEAERVVGRDMAERLSMSVLVRAWQMLLKGLSEAQSAPLPFQATEMVLVRLAYAADLPAPAEIVAALAHSPAPPPTAAAAPATAAQADGAGGAGGAEPEFLPSGAPGTGAEPVGSKTMDAAPGTPNQPRAALAASPEPAPPAPAEPLAEPGNFEAVVALFAEKGETELHSRLLNDVHLVHFEPGRIEFRPGGHAPRDLANRLGEMLGRWTGRRWVVSVSSARGESTLAEQATQGADQRQAGVADDPLVKAVLETFPGATIGPVHELGSRAPAEEARLDPAGGGAAADPEATDGGEDS